MTDHKALSITDLESCQKFVTVALLTKFNFLSFRPTIIPLNSQTLSIFNFVVHDYHVYFKSATFNTSHILLMHIFCKL